jgi:predicted metal-dependent peptidase
MAPKNQAAHALALGRVHAARFAPYFSAAIMKLVPVEVPLGTLSKDGTMGVTENYVLVYEQPIARWTPEEIGGVLVHEIMHIIQHHAKRCKVGSYEPERWNVAADLEINDDLRVMNVKLPDVALYPDTAYGFKNSLTAEQYYVLLEDPAGKKPSTGTKPSSGQCGSCSGHAMHGEVVVPPELERSTAEAAVVERQVAEAVSKHQGRLPANLKVWAEKKLMPSVVPWERKLETVTRRSIASAMGQRDYTYRRPSRRQAALGYGPGRAVLPALNGNKPLVCMFIDTSGSMLSEMVRALSETNAIIKAAGADIQFLTCDAEVHAYDSINSIEKAKKMLKGGGGTDFRPAFAAIAKAKRKPDLIACVTDGYATYPREKPSADMLWLVTPRGQIAVPWGERIYMDNSR